MDQIVLRRLRDYELLDSGKGYKLERFGSYVLSRPDPGALWNKRLSESSWKNADAEFFSGEQAQKNRWQNRSVAEPWRFSYGPLSLLLRLTPFKHTGLFPEQIENWEWFGDILKKRNAALPGAKEKASVLNLFAYTGGASLFAAAAGASVTHVDASKPSLQWAKENLAASNMPDTAVRWILDDAVSFAQREVRRKKTYDGIILDPPSFGRSPSGKVFKFERDIHPLLRAISQLLSKKPLFVLINSYATGLSAEAVKNIASDYIQGIITCGELNIPESGSGRLLPCSQFVRIEI